MRRIDKTKVADVRAIVIDAIDNIDNADGGADNDNLANAKYYLRRAAAELKEATR